MSSQIFTEFTDMLRKFGLFDSLPRELRYWVWEDDVKYPGMHFAKLGEAAANSDWLQNPPADEDDPPPDITEPCNPNVADEDAIKEVAPRKLQGLTLTEPVSFPEGDISQYRVVLDHVQKLSSTSEEAKAVAEHLFRVKPSLGFDNDEDPVSLPNKDDVLFIEYFPHDLYQKGCSLCVDPFIPKLENVRVVAIRFCHEWAQPPPPGECKTCLVGNHKGPMDKQYPLHLIQFLIRTFPSLQRVWLVDHFLLPVDSSIRWNTDGWDPFDRPGVPFRDSCAPMLIPAPKKYVCKNRIYHEARHGKWDIKDEAVDVMNWLNNNFVWYGEKSKYSRLLNDPIQIEFGLLACEWTYPIPAAKGFRPRRVCTKLTASRKRDYEAAKKALAFRQECYRREAERVRDADAVQQQQLSVDNPR